MRLALLLLLAVGCTSMPARSPEAAERALSGRIVFSTEPIAIGAVATRGQTRFSVGEPIYGAVFLDAPMNSVRGPDREGEVEITIAGPDGDRRPCGGNALPADLAVSTRLLESHAFTVDAVRSPAPSRVRQPDIDYLPSCFVAYESFALAKQSMDIHVRVAVTTFAGRATTTLAEQTITVEAVDDPAPRLVRLRAMFADQATFGPSKKPTLDAAALEAVRRRAREDRKSSFTAIAASVDDDAKHADVVFARPDGTCFVEPQIVLEDTSDEHEKCASELEVAAIHHVVDALPSTPSLEAAVAEWSSAHANLFELQRFRGSRTADEASATARRTLDAASKKLHRMAPSIPTSIDASACEGVVRVRQWPDHDAPRPYDIACRSIRVDGAPSGATATTR